MDDAKSEKRLSSETFWVLGGGHFGKRAVSLLRTEEPNCKIVLVDKQQVTDLPAEIEVIRRDAVVWFAENFIPGAEAGRIIPALPVHLVAEWLLKKFSDNERKLQREEIPEKVIQQLPNPLRVDFSRVVLSHADFLCPEFCIEPDIFCTYSGKKRPEPLYLLLEKISAGDFTPLIVKSRQFAPGVGGFYPVDLWDILEKVKSLSATFILVGTACKCHGIIDGLCLSELVTLSETVK